MSTQHRHTCAKFISLKVYDCDIFEFFGWVRISEAIFSRKNFGYHLKMFDFDLKAIMNFESQSKNLHSCLGTTVKGVGFFCLSGRLGSRL